MKRFILGIFLTMGVLVMIRALQKGINPYNVIIETASSAAQMATRGLRNNNAGNIRINPANNWRGKISPSTDTAFEQFETPEDGIRALGIVITNYYRKYGDNTIAKIVARFAPSNENDTTAYINAVSKNSGIAANTSVNLVTDFDAKKSIVAAIIKHENGIQPYTDEVLTRGLA